MRPLGMTLGLAQRATASGARLFQILDREPNIVRRAGYAPAAGRRRRGRLTHVTLRYEGANREALHDVSLDSTPARTIALVGAPARERPRWSHCSAPLRRRRGRGALDGVDVRAVDRDSLRRAIAVVDDAPFLFCASVRDNIAYADPDATHEQVEQAARRAQAHEFIDAAARRLRRRASASAD